MLGIGSSISSLSSFCSLSSASLDILIQINLLSSTFIVLYLPLGPRLSLFQPHRIHPNAKQFITDLQPQQNKFNVLRLSSFGLIEMPSMHNNKQSKRMCLPCMSSNRRVWSFMENRTTGYPIKFDHNEVEELRKKFRRISGNKQFIDKPTFQQNMGILGLHSVYGFSDRLFNSFDTDIDGKISFQDFVEYMEILKSGSDKNKARSSYRLIDVKNTNAITKQDFTQFLDDYFRSWTSITNSIITPEMKEKADDYVHYVFGKVHKDTGKDYIDFRYYAENLFFDKDFTEAFEFITEGVANMFITGKTSSENSVLYKVIREIKRILAVLEPPPSEHTESMMSFSPDALSPYPKSKKSSRRESFMVQEVPPMVLQQVPKFTHTTKKKHPWLGRNRLDPNQSSQHRQFDSTIPTTHLHNSTNCTNCVRVQVLEKKINFLTAKLKEIVQQTKGLYEKIGEKLYESASMKKKQTEDNIHHMQTQRKNTSQGNMVFFGDDNWNLVLNMMIGIQMAVRSVRGYQEMIYQQPRDFNLKYYFELIPRRFGGQDYISRICSFTDYAPNTFNHIRKIFNIDNEEYINSIGPNKLMTSLMMGEVTSLSGLTSQGKSGSFFFYTADGKYMLKTIHYREYKHLRSILEDYYSYVKDNPDTLITKFFGLHKLIEKDQQGQVIGKSYFVIMANVFNTPEHIVERYDIKGSWYGRENSDPNPKATKKDNDFKKRPPIELSKQDRDKLIRITRKDAEFFRKHDIIDYSLLIGVIHQDSSVTEMRKSKEDPAELRNSQIYEGKNQSYIFGIIDILTEYNTRKAMEFYFKRVVYGSGISAVPPDEYAERFVNFIDKSVFKKPSKLEESGKM